jgi:hypothetical protein
VCTWAGALQGDGFVEEAGGHLRQAQLSETDWKQFAEAIHELALKRERIPGGFDSFVRVIEKCNYTILLDAANIAFYNTLWLTEQNRPNARFQWLQVKAVFEAVKAKYPEQEILVVVSGARTRRNCVHSEQEQQFLDYLKVSQLVCLRVHACDPCPIILCMFVMPDLSYAHGVASS